MKNFSKLLQCGWDYRKSIFAYFAANAVLAAVTAVAVLYIPRYLVNEIVTEQNTRNIIVAAALFFVTVGICGFIVSFMKSEYLVILKRLRSHLLRMALKKDLTRDYADLENPEKMNDSHYVYRMLTDFRRGVEGMYTRFFGMTASVVTVMLYIWVLFALNILIGLFILVFTILLYMYTLKHNRLIVEYDQQQNEPHRKRQYLSFMTAQYEFGKEVRVFGIADWLLDKYAVLSGILRGFNIKSEKSRYRISIADILFAFVRSGMVYAYLFAAILRGEMSIPDFTLYFAAVTLFSNEIKQIFDGIAFIAAEMKPIGAFFDFVALADEHESGGEKVVPAKGGYTVEFRDVSFKYPSSDTYVLKNISFTIAAGEKLALVGINGAGKTTLVKLLARLFKPSEGKILLNGVNINELDLKEYRRLFSVVFQEINLIAASLAENVALDDAGLEERTIENALEKAGFGDKYRSFEKGTKTQLLKNLHPEGIELSGGEKQKIAIARALYRDGGILIMDEPTAALDAIAEYELYNNFASLAKEKTMLFISHRLVSTRFCDNILLLSDGGVGEYGSHEELMARQGLYFAMFNTQMQYYKEEGVCHARD